MTIAPLLSTVLKRNEFDSEPYVAICCQSQLKFLLVLEPEIAVIYSCNNRKGRVALVVDFVILFGPDKISAIDSTSLQIAIPAPKQ
jgi:hypothetical protein